jgi:predicted lysophospholipase L1 biosynthesis ABC-type transport system permease subunit
VAWARLGLGSLHAPGSPAGLILVALGLGLSILTTLGCVQANITSALREQIPADAPSFYFIDIQPNQVAPFEALLRKQPGVRSFEEQPSMRARIVAINGVPVEQAKVTPETRWALQGDRHVVAGGLSGAAAGVAGCRAGAWLGTGGRRHAAHQPGWARYRPEGGEPARRRLAQHVLEFHHGGQPGTALQRAADRDFSGAS